MKKIVTLLLIFVICLQMFGCGITENPVTSIHVAKVTDKQVEEDLEAIGDYTGITITHNLNKDTMVDEVMVDVSYEYTYGTLVHSYKLIYYYNYNSESWVFQKQSLVDDYTIFDEKKFCAAWHGERLGEEIDIIIRQFDFENKEVVCEYYVDGWWGTFEGSGTYQLNNNWQGYNIVLKLSDTESRTIEFNAYEGLHWSYSAMIRK